MKKLFLIVLVLLILGAIGGWIYFKNSQQNKVSVKSGENNLNQFQTVNQDNTNLSTSSGFISNSKNSNKNTYSMEEVKLHNSKVSCWSVIGGKVYDLTSWISKHPGGEGAILSICGKDGTYAFENQHGGQEKPAKILTQFEIGKIQ
jgi:cytochrome b involved in lipid metabolism